MLDEMIEEHRRSFLLPFLFLFSSFFTFTYIQTKYMPLLSGRVDDSCVLLARFLPLVAVFLYNSSI
jgi:hypothetical protein